MISHITYRGSLYITDNVHVTMESIVQQAVCQSLEISYPVRPYQVIWLVNPVCVGNHIQQQLQ